MISERVHTLFFKNISGYVSYGSNYYRWDKFKVYSCNIQTYYKYRNSNDKPKNIKYNKIFAEANSEVLQYRGFVSIVLKDRTFCTKCKPKKEDIFGDIGFARYDKVDMDEEEKEEEEFQDNEVRVPRRAKPSTGQYSSMIKAHIAKGDLSSALDVLTLVKTNRDKPTAYMYNLLIRAYAVQGDLNQCFSLYNKMKKRQLTPNSATYNSLFNACAEFRYSTLAIEKLNNLRIHLNKIGFILNESHYNTLVKAYSRHNDILQAFAVVDEMRDKRLPIREITYNCLLHAAISDKEAGMRHALILWHLMRSNKVKPSLLTYNLFLRAMRDTKFGNYKISDILTPELIKNELCFSEGERPNLLSSPPIIGTLPVPVFKADKDMKDNLIFGEEESSRVVELLPDTQLNEVFQNNRFILFGGLQNMLNMMRADGITPNAVTATLLLELLPNTANAEDWFLNYLQNTNIALDIDFYNMLIKRKSLRKEYDLAKKVLAEIQRKHMTPNLMTFGVLALGCIRSNEARELLDGLEIAGYVPNAVIIGTLISNACRRYNTNYVIELLHYMSTNKITPSNKLFTFLERYKETLTRMATSKKKLGFMKKKVVLKENLERFEREYSKWKSKVDSQYESK